MNAPTSLRLCLCFLVSLFLAACLSDGSQELSDEEKLDLYVTTAQYLYEDGSLDRAEEQALKGLEIEGDNVPLRRVIGWIRLRKGSNVDNDIARGVFLELLDEGDESASTRLGLGLALERLGLAYDETSRAFAKGDREAPEGESAEDEARRLAALSREHWAKALALYEGTLAEGEGNTAAMNGLQRTHALLGQYEDSILWSERLLERSREEHAAWERMLTSEDLTDTEEGFFVQNERSARQLQIDTHLFRAAMLYRLERYEDALSDVMAVSRLDPQLPQAYGLRAQLSAKLGEPEEAIEFVDRFLKLSNLPYEDPQIQKAFDLRTECEEAVSSREG